LFMTALGVVGPWWRHGGPATCAFDGSPIEPIYRVRVVPRGGTAREFCCIRCAQLWRKQWPQLDVEVFVTDEVSGAEMPAARATFVRSQVVTSRAMGDRIHTFRSQADAEAHARAHRGFILHGEARPFP
ncbi:MAG: nitrous oxide reductase accessory protein NosL, partial [Gemmataceae bacterium]|nr:nitrous oxide reductase accessory protein NosL [Gemmataceae bacterium]